MHINAFFIVLVPGSNESGEKTCHVSFCRSNWAVRANLLEYIFLQMFALELDSLGGTCYKQEMSKKAIALDKDKGIVFHLTWASHVFYLLNLNGNMKACVWLNEQTNRSDTFARHLQMPLWAPGHFNVTLFWDFCDPLLRLLKLTNVAEEVGGGLMVRWASQVWQAALGANNVRPKEGSDI